jgi:hypothetical protein
LDLGRIPDPQLELQFLQQTLEPPGMPARFHANSNRYSPTPKLTIEAFSFLSMLQTPFFKLTT